jgi:hypothetical protein
VHVEARERVAARVHQPVRQRVHHRRHGGRRREPLPRLLRRRRDAVVLQTFSLLAFGAGKKRSAPVGVRGCVDAISGRGLWQLNGLGTNGRPARKHLWPYWAFRFFPIRRVRFGNPLR